MPSDYRFIFAADGWECVTLQPLAEIQLSMLNPDDAQKILMNYPNDKTLCSWYMLIMKAL